MGTERAEENRERAAGRRKRLRARRRAVPVLRRRPRGPAGSPGARVGRSATCEVQLSSALVSRRHARLTLTHLGVTIEDLGSRNGVYVNSVRVIGSARLKLGDRLAIGDEVLVFEEREEKTDPGEADTSFGRSDPAREGSPRTRARGDAQRRRVPAPRGRGPQGARAGPRRRGRAASSPAHLCTPRSPTRDSRGCVAGHARPRRATP